MIADGGGTIPSHRGESEAMGLQRGSLCLCSLQRGYIVTPALTGGHIDKDEL